MIIAFDAKRMFNNFTGLGNYSRTLVEMLSTYYPENKYYLYTPSIKLCPQTQCLLDNQHTKVFLPDGLLKGSLWRTFTVSDLVRAHGVNIYHGLSHELPIGLPTKDIATVVTVHDVAWRTFPAMYKPWDRWIYDQKTKSACQRANAIIAISEETKKDICRFYKIEPEKVYVVYQPVSLHYYQSPNLFREREILKKYYPDIPEHFWLNVGSINQRKNLLGLVKALELISEEQRLPLVVVGKGKSYKEEVQQYIAQHHLEKWVIFKDNVNDAYHLRAFYSCAKFFAYPSFAEGFGLPIVESLLCETPVLTSNCSCLPEAAGPHSICVNPYSIQSIADGYLKLLQENKFLHIRGQKSREWAYDNFSPAILAKRIMKIYSDVIHQFQ